MKKYQILLLILAVGILLAGGYLLYDRKEKSKLAQNVSWSDDKVTLDNKPFHYTVKTVAKQGETEKYIQTVEGDYSEGKVKGSYEFKGDQVEIKKEFILIGNAVYSHEGEGNDKKWFVWTADSFNEAIYYTPEMLMESIDKKSLMFSKRTNKEVSYNGTLARQLRMGDGGLNQIFLEIDIKSKTINEAIVKGKQIDSDLEKTITFSNYGKKVEIQAPKEEETAR